MPPKRANLDTEILHMSFNHNGRKVDYTMTRKQSEEVQYIKDTAHKTNPEKIKKAIELEAELAQLGIMVDVKTRAYKTLTEGLEHEDVKPRNYLSLEVIEILGAGDPKIFYWGKYASLDDAKTKILTQIKNGTDEPKPERKIEVSETQRAKRQPRETTGTDSGDATSIRSQFRVRKFPGNS